MLSPDEVEQAVRACAGVRVMAPFYPLLQPFRRARLAANPPLATKLGRLDARQAYRLWEHLKDRQLGRPFVAGTGEATRPARAPAGRCSSPG